MAAKCKQYAKVLSYSFAKSKIQGCLLCELAAFQAKKRRPGSISTCTLLLKDRCAGLPNVKPNLPKLDCQMPT